MFIELLLVLAVILFLSYKSLKYYFNPIRVDKETKSFISEQGIDTSSQISIIESTRSKIKDLNQQINKRQEQP